MSPDPRTDIADSIASLGRHWIWVLSFGILTVTGDFRVSSYRRE